MLPPELKLSCYKTFHYVLQKMERECDDDEVDGIGSTTVQERSSVPFTFQYFFYGWIIIGHFDLVLGPPS